MIWLVTSAEGPRVKAHGNIDIVDVSPVLDIVRRQDKKRPGDGHFGGIVG